MDPFEKLPEEIHSQILKHFNLDELLNSLSFVSKKWYQVIGKSSICMQKIRLNLRSKRKTDFTERIETFKWMSTINSRKYMYLQVNCLFDENVSMEFYNFLKSCNSVEVLSVRSMKLEESVGELPQLSLQKLEYLKVMFIPREIVNRLITSSCNLKQLILWNETPLSYDDLNYLPNEKTMECVRNCIAKNPMLNELEIQGRPNFFSFFHQDTSPQVDFKLSKLTIKIEMSPDLVTPEQNNNIINFLKTQTNCLEYFYLDKICPDILKFAFNDLPKLKTIRFDFVIDERNKIDVKELLKEVNVNELITTIELPYIKLFDDLKEFLLLVPNVKSILIGHVIPRLLEHVTSSLNLLENLVYRYDDSAGGCETVYANMKKDNPEINQTIKLSLCNEFL